jgi:hypothetical protein
MVMNESKSMPCQSNEVVDMGSTPSHTFFILLTFFFLVQVRVNTTVSFLHTVVLGNGIELKGASILKQHGRVIIQHDRAIPIMTRK